MRYRNVTEVNSGCQSGVVRKCSYKESNKHTWLKTAGLAVLTQVLPWQSGYIMREIVALALCIKPESRDAMLRPDAESVQMPLSVSAPCMFTEFRFPRAGLTLDSLFTLGRTALRSAPARPSSPASGLTPHQAAHGLGRLYTCRITYRNLLVQTDPALMPAKELSEHFLKESRPCLFL